MISQFNPLEMRNDTGALWENFMFIERLKFRTYTRLYANMYFWRTYEGQEIDLVEERDGNYFGYEFKWSEQKAPPAPANWLKAYPQAEFRVFHPGNAEDFILPERN